MELTASRGSWQRIAVLGALFGFMGLAMSAAARSPLLGLLGPALIVAPYPILLRSRRTWPKRLDAQGVTLRDGRLLPWAELEGVRAVHVGTRLKHYELIFKGGKAPLYFMVLAQREQVLALVRPLEEGKNPLLAA